MTNIPIYSIAAMCDSNRGIGLNGNLPWSLPNEYKYFLTVSTRVKDETKKNAVVVGRLTFESIISEESIPDFFYVVVSSSINKEKLNLKNRLDPQALTVATSYSDAIDYISNNLSDKVENIFVIGGSNIYKNSFEFKRLDRLYLTHIYHEFKCDTFLEPANFLDSFEKLENFNDFSVEGFEIDKLITDSNTNIQYRCVVYRRKF
jgi:dihydrofolate reductase